MARVLPQGSRLNEDMKVAQSVTQPQSVRGAVTQGEKLSGDLQSIMAGGAKIARDYQETNKTANVNFAQKSADESKVNLYKDLAVLDANTTPDTDLRLKKDAQEALYQHYGNKVFDNEDAQDRFDKQYHNPVSVNIANKGAVLEKDANKQDHDKIVTDTTNDYRLLVSSGEQITKETLDSGVKSQTAGGYLTVGESQKIFASEATLGFEDKAMNDLPTMLETAGYDANVGITKEVTTKVFNDTFSAFATMEEDGSITWGDNIESEARSEILGEWKSFSKSIAGLKNNEINNALKNYQVAREENNKEVMNGNTLPATIEENNKKLAKQAKDLKNLSTSEMETIHKDIQRGDEQLNKSKNVQIAMNGSAAQVKGFTESGVEYVDLQGVTQTASAEYVSNQIKAQHKEHSDVITSNPVGSKEYNKSMSDAIMLEYKTGVKNPVVNNYVKGITGTGLMISVDEVNKSIDVAGKMRNTGTANSMLKNTAYLAVAQQLQAQHTAGKLTDEEYVLQTNKRLEQMRMSTFSRIESGEFRTSWKTAITSAQDMWFKNTEIDLRTADALLIKYAAEGGSPNATEQDMVDYIKSNVVEFAGSFTGSANSLGGFFTDSVGDSTSALRMTDSQGVQLEDYVYEDGMENIIEQYNQNNPESKISVSDLRVVSPYDAKAGKDEITWSVSMVQNGNEIPLKSYTGDEMIKMAGWKSTASLIDSDDYSKRLETLKKNQEFMAKLKEKRAEDEANGVNKKFKVKRPENTIHGVDTSVMSTSEIKTLQKKIGVDADGKFGAKSKRALENFESNENIASQIEGMSTSQVNQLVEIESGGQNYEALNKDSGAYGRYQFIPSTGYQYAKKVGYTGGNDPEALKEFMTPEKQDEMFVALTKDNIKALEKKGLPVNTFTLYAAHQQGVSGAEKIIKGEAKDMSSSIFRNMVSNLGYSNEEERAILDMFDNKDVVALMQEQWVSKWSKKLA